MVHRVSQKKLSRDTNARRALLRNLAADLILHEKIVTTEAKAKAVRPVVEKLVTRAKKDSSVSRRYLTARLDRENAVRKLLELIGPTFKERPGGYVRIIKLPPRAGDNAEMAVIEFVEGVSEVAARKKLAGETTGQKSKNTSEKDPAYNKKKVTTKKITARSKNLGHKKVTTKKSSIKK